MRLCRILAVALALSAPSSPGWGLQLSDIETDCRIALRDTAADTNFQRFSNSQLASFINDGQAQINNTVEPLVGVYAFDLSAGIAEYALPSDFKSVYRLSLANQRVQAVNYNGLDANYTNWTIAVSTPMNYYIDAYDNAQVYVGFYPTPKVTTAGGEVLLFYFQIPVTLVNATDVPFNGKSNLYAYHDALTQYCAMRGWTVQNRADLASLDSSLFTADVAAMKNDVNFTPDFNPAATGYRGPPSQNQ